jgi:hypothetical protein
MYDDLYVLLFDFVKNYSVRTRMLHALLVERWAVDKNTCQIQETLSKTLCAIS